MAQLPGDARVNQYTATSGQTTFTYDFKIYDDDEITVQQNGTVLTLTTHYTVTDAGEDAGGTIVLVTGATKDDIITLTGNTMVETDTTFTNGGEFAASAINGEYTKIDNLVSELVTDKLKYLKLKTYDAAFDTELDTITARKCIVVNAAGTGIEMSASDPDTSEAAAAVSAAAALASENAAAASETAASGYAAAASTSANDAAASAASIAPAAFASDLIPDADGTRDLGSAAKEWAEVHCTDAFVYDDLAVTDDASIGGNLTMTGSIIGGAAADITLNTDKFTVDATNGNTVIDGTLTVGGELVSGSPKAATYTYTVAQGTHGGTYTTGYVWQIRPINTEVFDTIGATLTANRITLPAGTYIVVANASIYNVGEGRLRIYDHTNTATLATGPSQVTNGRAHISVNASFTLAADAAIEVDQQGVTPLADQGMGTAVNNASWGTETYLTLSIVKLV